MASAIILPRPERQAAKHETGKRFALLLEFQPTSASASGAVNCRVYRNDKHIATLVRGAIRPKRHLTKEETAGIRTYAVTELCDSLANYPAIQKRIAAACGIERTV